MIKKITLVILSASQKNSCPRIIDRPGAFIIKEIIKFRNNEMNK